MSQTLTGAPEPPTAERHGVAAVAEAIRELAAAGTIVVCGGEAPAGRCELVCAAELVSAELVNFMVREARGLVSLALTGADCERLDLRLIGEQAGVAQPAYTVSIEAAEGVSTGISAADRAHTVRVAVDPASTPGDLVAPGHVVPIRAADGGVLARRGHAEAAVDLARLAGLRPAAVVCQILNEDGTLAWIPDMAHFCQRHGLAMVTIEQVLEHRLRSDRDD